MYLMYVHTYILYLQYTCMYVCTSYSTALHCTAQHSVCAPHAHTAHLASMTAFREVAAVGGPAAGWSPNGCRCARLPFIHSLARSPRPKRPTARRGSTVRCWTCGTLHTVPVPVPVLGRSTILCVASKHSAVFRVSWPRRVKVKCGYSTVTVLCTHRYVHTLQYIQSVHSPRSVQESFPPGDDLTSLRATQNP